MTEPLRLQLDVGCSVEHAFTVWTEGIDSWWPTDHTVSAEPGLRVVLRGGSVAGSTSGRPRGSSTTGVR